MCVHCSTVACVTQVTNSRKDATQLVKQLTMTMMVPNATMNISTAPAVSNAYYKHHKFPTGAFQERIQPVYEAFDIK